MELYPTLGLSGVVTNTSSNKFMGRRANRRSSDLSRRRPFREPYAKVLIVCEGEKTEPNYFNELKDYYRLNSANVRITGDCGSGPISVVRYAIELYGNEKEAGDPFDKVFCVFDRDRHASYHQAIDMINRAEPDATFKAIISIPCFEYWLLLHYGENTKPYEATQGKSPCAQVVKELGNFMGKYSKGHHGIFNRLLDQLDDAKAYAERCLVEVRRVGTENPSTNVHELVDFLQKLKS